MKHDLIRDTHTEQTDADYKHADHGAQPPTSEKHL